MQVLFLCQHDSVLTLTAEIQFNLICTLSCWSLKILSSILREVVVSCRIAVSATPRDRPVVVHGELEAVLEVCGKLPAALSLVVCHVLSGVVDSPAVVVAYTCDGLNLSHLCSVGSEVNLHLIESVEAWEVCDDWRQ